MRWISDFIDVLHDKRIIKMRPAHWKARLTVSLVLLILSTMGIFISYIAPNFAWYYWCWMVPLFAGICIWLSWYVSRSHTIEQGTIWHEILHWLGLLVAVYIVSVMVHTGIVSYLTGALFVLTLLALTLFLAGVHFDSIFIIIGLFLALLALVSIYFVKYMVIIIVPAVIIIALLMIWRYIVSTRKSS